ncbi:flavodoxin family protein [Oryzomonas japonica]
MENHETKQLNLSTYEKVTYKMNKKILVLSSSPRRGGNSDLLCDQFTRGAQEAGHHAEKIFVKDKKINYCTGCGTCLNGKKACPQKDDMAEVLEKMIAADVIVMATPVYFYTMCGQMKTLIDRTCSRYTEINNKNFYFIVAAADDSTQAMERTLEGFRGFTSCLNGAKEKGIIYGVGAWNIGDITESPAMKQAYEMGKNG